MSSVPTAGPPLTALLAAAETVEENASYLVAPDWTAIALTGIALVVVVVVVILLVRALWVRRRA